MTIDQLISGLIGGNTTSNGVFVKNEAERDGNSNEPLFYIDQPSVGITGGTTLTSISPYGVSTTLGGISLNPTDALNELLNGKLSLNGIVWILIAIVAGWFLLKK